MTPNTHESKPSTIKVEPDEKMLEVRDLALSQAANLNFRVRGKHCRYTPFHEKVLKNRKKEKLRRLENQRQRKIK